MTITTSQFIAINTGLVANDGTGDDLRTAFIKVNEFFANIADIGFDTGNISATGSIEVAGNITASNINVTNLQGLIQSPTQSQITSVGTLTGLTSSGVVHVTNATESTIFNNGALIVDGGVGIKGNVFINGNLFVANIMQTSVTTLVTTSPLVFFDTIPAYPYNFDIGFYGHFTGGVGNVSQYSGFVRDDSDGRWNLFSNVASGVITTQMPLTNAKYDTLVLGNIVINAPTPTAITNGGTTATGNIGTAAGTFNYGYFTNLTGTLQTTAQNTITSASALATVGTITTGKWSGLFGAVSGANLTILTAGNLIGTISSTVMGNSTVYIGTTAITLNRATAQQALTGVSIDGAAGSVAASAITGTALPTLLVTSSLTTVGTLTGLAATGVIRTTGIVYANAAVASTTTTTGALVVTGGAGISGDINAGNNITATYHTGTLVTAAQPNITTVGTLTGLTVTGNILANIAGTHYGNSIGTTAAYTGNVSASYFNGNGSLLTGVTATSVGTLTGLTVSGAIIVNSGNNVTAIINGGTPGVGNIGASGAGFNTIFAKSTSAVYADLAENYVSDCNYAAGTVVVFGGEHEITTTTLYADVTVAGVISTNPAYLMNGTLDGQPVALRGRVPVKVQGFTRKGDLLVTGNIPGTAISVGRDTSYGAAIFAKALENKDTKEVNIIEAVII